MKLLFRSSKNDLQDFYRWFEQFLLKPAK